MHDTSSTAYPRRRTGYRGTSVQSVIQHACARFYLAAHPYSLAGRPVCFPETTARGRAPDRRLRRRLQSFGNSSYLIVLASVSQYCVTECARIYAVYRSLMILTIPGSTPFYAVPPPVSGNFRLLARVPGTIFLITSLWHPARLN